MEARKVEVKTRNTKVAQVRTINTNKAIRLAQCSIVGIRIREDESARSPHRVIMHARQNAKV